MVSLLHLAQFSHLIFEECHSELCGVFGISRNSQEIIQTAPCNEEQGKLLHLF